MLSNSGYRWWLSVPLTSRIHHFFHQTISFPFLVSKREYEGFCHAQRAFKEPMTNHALSNFE